MKIGILTMHHSYNYGAMLQAYATISALTTLGHDVEFIDYSNSTFTDQRKIFLSKWSFFNFLRNLRTLLNYGNVTKRRSVFEEFYNEFRVSSTKYNEISTIDYSKYDIVLTGSDQTFALYLTGEPSEMKSFFQVDNTKTKKVSYASSMGEMFSKITKEDEIWLREAFQGFDHLSVREEKSALFIERLTGVKPVVVLDPTMLLSRETWSKMAKQPSNVTGDYIAFYTVLSAPWVIKYVKAFAQKTGLKVIALHSKTRYEAATDFNYVTGIGPHEFVSVIKNAKYVLTTSFHATVFSIIFNKQFESFKILEGNRLQSLLTTCQLRDLLIDESNAEKCPILEKAIDFERTNKILNIEIQQSLNFLKESLVND